MASTRLPGKVLLDIAGRPMLWHVWQRVMQMQTTVTVTVAADSDAIADRVMAWGGRAVLTDPACQSGTERIASIVDQLRGDLIINVQGDEPLIDPDLLDRLVTVAQSADAAVTTPIYAIERATDITDPHVVKVVCAADGAALYFSRSPIPFVRDVAQTEWLHTMRFWGHIGVYAFRRELLEAYAGLPIGRLERAERLEQLRFLEAGYRIQTLIAERPAIAVDTPEDLRRVRAIIENENRR
jgi:3-deoxy-manno-octulosonate cytidylyltransferase (CMP-KDO synthetase)